MMKRLYRVVLIPLIVGLVALPAAPVAAAEPSAKPDAAAGAKANGGTPAMSVARLKIDKGTAWVRPADSGEWQEYNTNTPLTERSRVSVPQGSQAQILFREGQSLILRDGAEVEIRELGEKHDTFRLQSGAVGLSLPEEGFAPVRFRVPGKREVDISAPGRYALSADLGTSTTKFVVGEGEATVSGEGATAVGVKAGEEASISTEIRVARSESTAPAPPGAATEPKLTDAEREAGVPPEAASELRDYGHWVYTPQYGYVWSPYVEAGWTPYYYGHWVWVYPYGWVWVANEPWGWWPYHYGWWFNDVAFGWVWCPFFSFVNVDFFFFGHSRFFFHRAFFFGANVRFVNDGRFIRWTPARPGTTVTRATFSRSDTRLAQWNQPLQRGVVNVRGEGGRLTAWQGHGMASAGAVAGRKAPSGGEGRALAGGGGRVSARMSTTAAIRGSASRGGAVERGGPRPGAGPSIGGSRGLSGPRGFSGPRASVPRMSAPSERSLGGSGSFRGEAPPSRGFNGGGSRGFEGGFGGGGFRGFGGGGFGGGSGRMR